MEWYFGVSVLTTLKTSPLVKIIAYLKTLGGFELFSLSLIPACILWLGYVYKKVKSRS